MLFGFFSLHEFQRLLLSFHSVSESLRVGFARSSKHCFVGAEDKVQPDTVLCVLV